MAFKFNPITAALELASQGISRFGSTIDKSITRWNGNNNDSVQGSITLVQDSGAIEAQAFITNKLIIDTVTVNASQVMITSEFIIEPTGELIIEADGEVVLV